MHKKSSFKQKNKFSKETVRANNNKKKLRCQSINRRTEWLNDCQLKFTLLLLFTQILFPTLSNQLSLVFIFQNKFSSQKTKFYFIWFLCFNFYRINIFQLLFGGLSGNKSSKLAVSTTSFAVFVKISAKFFSKPGRISPKKSSLFWLMNWFPICPRLGSPENEFRYLRWKCSFKKFKWCHQKM